MLYTPPPGPAVRGVSAVAAVCGIVLLLDHAKRLGRTWLARRLRSLKLSAVKNMKGELSVRFYVVHGTRYQVKGHKTNVGV